MPDISQAAQSIGTFAWTEGDPVSLQWRINTDWSGNYKCEIRKTYKPTGVLMGHLDVVAVWNVAPYLNETLFTMTMSEADSKLIPAGKYYLDMQTIGGTTRIYALVRVDRQVTVVP